MVNRTHEMIRPLYWKGAAAEKDDVPQALDTNTKFFPARDWSLLSNKIQKFFNINFFTLVSIHELTKARNYFFSCYLENFCHIRTYRKIMHNKRMPYQRTQFQLFKLLYTLVLANCHFQIIQWSNSLNRNKAVDKCINLNKSKITNENLTKKSRVWNEKRE